MARGLSVLRYDKDKQGRWYNNHYFKQYIRL